LNEVTEHKGPTDSKYIRALKSLKQKEQQYWRK